MTLRRRMLGIAAAAIVCLLPRAFAFEPFAQTADSDGTREVRAPNNMILRWRVEGERLRVILDAPTGGWVGIGFHPESRMKGANLIIGYVRGAEVVIEDHFGTAAGRHQVDTRGGGTKDVSTVGGSESDGRTRIEFTMPLSSGDTQDKSLRPGQRVPVLLCFGSRDDLAGPHTVKAEAKGDITL